jgi:hypothetical protein
MCLRVGWSAGTAHSLSKNSASNGTGRMAAGASAARALLPPLTLFTAPFWVGGVRRGRGGAAAALFPGPCLRQRRGLSAKEMAA